MTQANPQPCPTCGRGMFLFLTQGEEKSFWCQHCGTGLSPLFTSPKGEAPRLAVQHYSTRNDPMIRPDQYPDLARDAHERFRTHILALSKIGEELNAKAAAENKQVGEVIQPYVMHYLFGRHNEMASAFTTYLSFVRFLSAEEQQRLDDLVAPLKARLTMLNELLRVGVDTGEWGPPPADWSPPAGR